MAARKPTKPALSGPLSLNKKTAPKHPLEPAKPAAKNRSTARNKTTEESPVPDETIAALEEAFLNSQISPTDVSTLVKALHHVSPASGVAERLLSTPADTEPAEPVKAPRRSRKDPNAVDPKVLIGFRAPKSVHLQLKAKASANGHTLETVLNRLVAGYLADD